MTRSEMIPVRLEVLLGRLRADGDGSGPSPSLRKMADLDLLTR